MIGPGGTKLRRVEFCLSPQKWFVAYHCNTTVQHVIEALFVVMNFNIVFSSSMLHVVFHRQHHTWAFAHHVVRQSDFGVLKVWLTLTVTVCVPLQNYLCQSLYLLHTFLGGPPIVVTNFPMARRETLQQLELYWVLLWYKMLKLRRRKKWLKMFWNVST